MKSLLEKVIETNEFNGEWILRSQAKWKSYEFKDIEEYLYFISKNLKIKNLLYI